MRGGIPPELRARVWPLLCGADAKRAALEADYYSRLLRNVEASEAEERVAREAAEGARLADAPRQRWELLDTLEQIDKDLVRARAARRPSTTSREGRAHAAAYAADVALALLG